MKGKRPHGWVRRIVDASIWGEGGVGPDDERVRGLLLVALPLLDIALMLFGVFAFASGVPALRDVFDPLYARVWSGMLGVMAAACLVGLAFPARWWKVERSGKAILATMLLVYSGALIFAGILAGDVGRSAVGFVPAALAPVLVWRIFDVTKDAKRNGWRGAPQ